MRKVIAIILITVISSSFTLSKRVDAMIKKEIMAVFNIETYTKERLNVSDAINNIIPIKITDNNFFKIKLEEEVLGYYYFGQAFGKADYFDFIVIFDTDLMVSKVKVVAYREDHGGEVGSKRWLRQFEGTSSDKTLKYQHDIAGISGATISVKSMMNEVNKLLKTVSILAEKKEL